MHALLQSQLVELGLRPDAPPTAEAWSELITQISATYEQAERAGHTAERSLDLSAREMRELHERLRHSNDALERDDVTAQKKAELVARENEMRFRATFDQAAVGIVHTSLDGKYLRVNRRFCEMLGYEESELIGMAAADYSHPDDARMGGPQRKSMLDGTLETFTEEKRYVRKDRSVLWTNRTVSLARDESGKPLYFIRIIEDITERKRVETELSRQAQELMSARAAADAANLAKSQFLANMSHEIRTPMNGVLGMTELLLDAGLNDAQRRYAQAIRASGEALLHILNDILDFSKIEAGRLELDPIEVNVRDLSEDALQLMALQAHEKGLELTCHVHPGVPENIRADPTRLRQVLLNLLGNALKFTERGEVNLSIERAPDSLVGAEPPQCLLRFTVTDTGIGINAEAQARLFQAFTQANMSTSRRFGGTGLGLAVSKQLAEMMGGEIGVHSEPEHGSSFWFTIRADSLDCGPPAPARAELTGTRVLIVDDNATNRSILLHQVTALGATCDLAEDGVAGLEAMRAALARGCAYHVALIDMKMPRMTGVELMDAVRSDTALRDTRLVMLTSLSSREAAATRSNVADASLTKPVRRGELFNVLASRTGATGSGTRAASTQDADALDCRGAHVLLAEDNPINQQIGRAMLERAGCRVTIAGNGRAAVDEWLAHPFTLILMDCQMPELDGFDAAREMRARETGRARVPIVAVTANAMEGDRERCLAAGMDDYLPKPFKRSDLKAMLRRWIDLAPTA